MPITATALTAATLTALDRDDDGALRSPVGHDPADQNEGQHSPAKHVATSDSAAGSSASAMTCSAMTTVHIPSAKTKIATAAINNRNSRKRKGATTRQPRAAPHGVRHRTAHSLGPWLPTERPGSNDLRPGRPRQPGDGRNPDALFDDPLAERLAGPPGMKQWSAVVCKR